MKVKMHVQIVLSPFGNAASTASGQCTARRLIPYQHSCLKFTVEALSCVPMKNKGELEHLHFTVA